MTIDVALYLAFLLVYRAIEVLCMSKGGSLKVSKEKPARDWTAGLVVLPFLLVLIGPPLEYMYFKIYAGSLSRVLGALLFVAAAFVRGRAHLDLKESFSMFIEKAEGQKLVEKGPYRCIRHPLYLGNLLLFIACPLFLASRISWIFTLLGLVGILIRIRIEERFLIKTMEGYREYTGRTSALIPGVF